MSPAPKRRPPSRPAPGRLPDTFDAQLAVIVRTPPEGPEWLHEIKYDGYRLGCLIDHGQVRLLTRRGNDWTSRFPEIRDAAARLRVTTAVLDGEAAIVEPDGRTSFQALQNAFGGGSRAGLVYFVFDLLYLDGEDIASQPLEARKERLQQLLGDPDGMIRYSEHVIGHGAQVFAEACRLHLEGIVSKRRDLPYRPGRHDGWLKTKCVRQQEFVVGGFTDPEGSRVGLGALLIGYYGADGNLAFAGKVGTGFTQKSAIELRARL